jgi:hypothetical protein
MRRAMPEPMSAALGQFLGQRNAHRRVTGNGLVMSGWHLPAYLLTGQGNFARIEES